ncbi:hypothetical protein KXV31_004485 [Aspergillus fumigatus]|nr:hypothetical protein KXX17_006684 [Aspergillus fumigatus]KAH1863053.1 hypothetical protein KXX01_003127 [Aspergillus fumigatus]KAH1913284.1 hypothetical protein KXW47_005832 [Aspergillus fumigatus]KAH2061743.1 hypothetical protein KXX03_003710 [Aspergillus fumigatus]KAH2362777.1 hypothetical protein KXV98_004674 [Aspergillus fumigatus]
MDPEILFLWALRWFTPADVLKSSELFAQFQDFLKRGSQKENEQLFTLRPLHIPISNQLPLKRRLPSDEDTPSNAILPSISQAHQIHKIAHRLQPSPQLLLYTPPASKKHSPTPLSVTPESSYSVHRCAFDYFVKLGVKNGQLQRLVKAAVGFIEKVEFNNRGYNVWSAKAPVFDSKEQDTLPRVCRLFRGRQKIFEDRKNHAYADRLSLVFIHHEVNERVRTVDSASAKNQKRTTVACKDIARELGKSTKALKRDRDQGRCYLQLLLEAGPGDLLALGSGQSTLWERSLQLEDISRLIEFRRKNYGEIERKVRELDRDASLAMAYGLIGYGWKPSELLSCQSCVVQKLRQFVNLHELSQHDSQAAEIGKGASSDHATASISEQREGSLKLASVSVEPGQNIDAGCTNHSASCDSSGDARQDNWFERSAAIDNDIVMECDTFPTESHTVDPEPTPSSSFECPRAATSATSEQDCVQQPHSVLPNRVTSVANGNVIVAN